MNTDKTVLPARYTAYRAVGPITVDGRLHEPSWQRAPKSTPFVDIVTGEPAWFDTRVAILWDDENLYFGFWAEETDVWGTLTKRDSKIWEENDLEIFIGGRDAYYEFEINALNTVYEVFWIWKDVHMPGGPYFGRPEFDPAMQRTMVLEGVGGHVHERGERWGFLDWDYPGLRTGDAPRAPSLFDLEHDPGEQHDVAAEHPDVVARLKARYEEMTQQLPAAAPGRLAPAGP